MSLYRNAVWFLKGLIEYTKGGYISASKKFKNEDLEVDCTGKKYMITGSNSGIGKQSALEIAKRGGTVYMVCRNREYAENAKKEIIEETKNHKVFVYILDLSKPKEVFKFAKSFAKEHSNTGGLDVLINNAGCMINTREETADELEMNFATNTLGTYLLTESLIPMLQKNSKPESRPRVITVSSGGMLTNKLDPHDLQTKEKSFDGTMVYAQTKRQQIVITDKWAKKYPDIQFSSMHPGWADTPAVRNAMPRFYEKMKNKLRTPEQGADTIVWLAISNNTEAIAPNKSGNFYQDRVSVSKHLPLA